MPSPVNPALISSIGSLVGQLFSIGQTHNINSQNYQNNVDLANLAYRHNLDMWNRANEYNTPSAQMARLRDAGLNPNLVYGKGAAMPAAQLPRYQAPKIDYKVPPQLELGNTIAQFQDFQLKKAQIDNVQAQTDNIKQRTVNESITQLLLGTRSKRADFELDKASKLYPYQFDFQKEKARGARLAADNLLHKKMNIKAQTRSIEQQTRMTGLRAKYQDMLNSMFSRGLNPNDELYWRVLYRWLEPSLKKNNIKL
jgi:hypothetical protein